MCIEGAEIAPKTSNIRGFLASTNYRILASIRTRGLDVVNSAIVRDVTFYAAGE